MISSQRIYVVNPMSSSSPTGMGVAGDSLIACLTGIASPVGSSIFKRINDAPIPGLFRIIFRQVVSELITLIYGRSIILFATHQGPIIFSGNTVVVVHDTICLRYPFQNKQQAILFLLILPIIANRSKKLVAISRSVKVELQRQLTYDCISQIKIIPSVSNRVEYGCRSPIGISERLARMQILFVGARFRHKRLDVALDVLSRLWVEGFRMKLVVVGCDRNVWRKDLEKCSVNGSVNAVEIIDYCSDEQLEMFYAESSFLLFLSDAEGLGFPPLEAMKRGCPVICNGVPELLETCGDSAWYVDSSSVRSVCDLIKHLYEPKSIFEIESKINSGIERCGEFSYKKVAQMWVDLVKAW